MFRGEQSAARVYVLHKSYFYNVTQGQKPSISSAARGTRLLVEAQAAYCWPFHGIDEGPATAGAALCKVDLSHWKATKEEAFASPPLIVYGALESLLGHSALTSVIHNLLPNTISQLKHCVAGWTSSI